MAVKGLYALQNGFMGFEKSGLFFGERSAEKARIPVSRTGTFERSIFIPICDLAAISVVEEVKPAAPIS